jgi:hypothetical protein
LVAVPELLVEFELEELFFEFEAKAELLAVLFGLVLFFEFVTELLLLAEFELEELLFDTSPLIIDDELLFPADEVELLVC